MPCIRITPEAGAVKNGEFRIVPLHRQLIERGLLEFVQASKDDYLFIKGDEDLAIVRDRAGRAGSMVSKWVREVVGLTDENIQPNHAWRHRFKTVARELGEDRLADAIQGHSDGRAATGYGAHTVRAMNVLIGKMPAYEVYEQSARLGEETLAIEFLRNRLAVPSHSLNLRKRRGLV